MNEKPQDVKSAAPENARPRHALFEPLALLLLSLATVGTAWCSFEAAAWGGAAQGTMNLSIACSREAVASELEAYQVVLLDVMLFSQFVNARAGSNDALASFYATRFRGEARPAFEAWMATRPFENTNAPAHPFVTNYYQPRLLTESRAAEAKALQLSQQAGEAGRTSRSYILVTVLLATALFCGGTASKFDHVPIRRGVLAVGLGAFLFAVGRLVLLPVQL